MFYFSFSLLAILFFWSSFLTVVSYSDDILDYGYSSPFEYREYQKELFRYGRRQDTPYPPRSPTPASVLSTNSISELEKENGLETTLSPDLPHTWNLEDLLVDFEEKRKKLFFLNLFHFFFLFISCQRLLYWYGFPISSTSSCPIIANRTIQYQTQKCQNWTSPLPLNEKSAHRAPSWRRRAWPPAIWTTEITKK